MTKQHQANPGTIAHLKRVSPELASIYTDVIRVLESESLNVSSIFVAHGLREIMNALVREVLWVEHSPPGKEILSEDRIMLMGQGIDSLEASSTAFDEVNPSCDSQAIMARAHVRRQASEAHPKAKSKASGPQRRDRVSWQRTIESRTNRQDHRDEVKLMYQLMLMTSDKAQIADAVKSWMTLRERFMGKAHVGNSWGDNVELTRNDLRRWISEFESVIDGLFVGYMRITDRLMRIVKESSGKEPTIKQVREAIIVARTAPIHWRVFFSQLDNPLWAPKLFEVEAFGKVPILHAEGKHEATSFGRWEAGLYLVRAAESNPNVVQEVVAQNQNQENVRIITVLLEAVSRLRAADIKPVKGHIRAWVRKEGVVSRAGFTIAQIMVKLIQCGSVSDAEQLAEELWSLEKYVEKLSAKEVASAARGNYIHSEHRMREYEFIESVQKNSSDMIEADPCVSLSIFCKLLKEYVQLERRRYGLQWDKDVSYIWRPAIENHPQNHPSDWRDSVVDAVRNSAIGYVKARRDRSAALAEVGEKMCEFSSPIFQRVTLHVYCEFQEDFATSDKLVGEAFSPILFESVYVHHELHRLVQTSLPHLSKSNKENLVTSWCQAQGGYALNDAALDESIGGAVLDWFAGIRDHVPERLRDVIHKAEECGYSTSPHPDFAVYRQGFVIERRSPLSEEELLNMQLPDLIAKIDEWAPPSDPFGPTPIGLANELEDVVATRSDEVLQYLPAFVDLDATYWVAVIDGIRKCEGKHEWTREQWEQLLRFLRDICKALACRPSRIDSWSYQDPSVALLSAARLIMDGLQQGHFDVCTLPKVWMAIADILVHAEPESVLGDIDDALNFTLNFAYGLSLHAVMAYLRSIHGLLGDKANEDKLLSESISSAWNVLEGALKGADDRANVARAVCGGNITSLHWIDSDWLEQNLEWIFPHHENTVDQWSVAWASYVRYFHPYRDIVDCLSAEYEFALTVWYADRNVVNDSMWWQRYVEHLCVMRMNGALERIRGGTETWEQFIRECDSKSLYKAIGYTGRQLSRQVDSSPTQSVSPDILERAKQAWSEVTCQVESESMDSERKCALAGFGWWVATGQFEPDWVLKHATRVVAVAGHIDELSKILKMIGKEGGFKKKLVFRFLLTLTQQRAGGDLLVRDARTIQELFRWIGTPVDDEGRRETRECLEFFMPLDPLGFAKVYQELLG